MYHLKLHQERKAGEAPNESVLPSSFELLQRFHSHAGAIYHGRQSGYCCAKQRLRWAVQQGVAMQWLY